METDRKIVREISKNMQTEIADICKRYHRQISNSDIENAYYGAMVGDATIGMMARLIDMTVENRIDEVCEKVLVKAKELLSDLTSDEQKESAFANLVIENPEKSIFGPISPECDEIMSDEKGNAFFRNMERLVRQYACKSKMGSPDFIELFFLLNALHSLMKQILFWTPREMHKDIIDNCASMDEFLEKLTQEKSKPDAKKQ